MLCTHGEYRAQSIYSTVIFRTTTRHARAIIPSLRQSRDSRRTDTNQHDAAWVRRPFTVGDFIALAAMMQLPLLGCLDKSFPPIPGRGILDL
jgi:hypothetical protein